MAQRYQVPPRIQNSSIHMLVQAVFAVSTTYMYQIGILRGFGRLGATTLEIYFEDANLHRVCCSRAELEAAYGSEDAVRIALRLGQLSAVRCVEDLAHLLVQWRSRGPRRRPLVEIAVAPALNLVVEPCDEPPLRSTGEVDWKEVGAVTIIGIEARQ